MFNNFSPAQGKAPQSPQQLEGSLLFNNFLAPAKQEEARKPQAGFVPMLLSQQDAFANEDVPCLIEDNDFLYQLHCFVKIHDHPIVLCSSLQEVLGIPKTDSVEENTKRFKLEESISEEDLNSIEKDVLTVLLEASEESSTGELYYVDPATNQFLSKASIVQVLQRGTRSSHAKSDVSIYSRRLSQLKELLTHHTSLGEIEEHSGFPIPLFQMIAKRLLHPFKEKYAVKYEALLSLQSNLFEQAAPLPKRTFHSMRTNATTNIENLIPTTQLQDLLRRVGIASESPEALTTLRTTGITQLLQPLLRHASLLVTQYPTPLFYRLHTAAPHTVLAHVTLLSTEDILHSLSTAFPQYATHGPLAVYGYGTIGEIRHLLSPSIANLIHRIHPTLSCDAIAMSVFHDLMVSITVEIVRHAAIRIQPSSHTTHSSTTHSSTTHSSTTTTASTTTSRPPYEEQVCGEIAGWQSILLHARENPNASYDEMDEAVTYPALTSQMITSAVRMVVTGKLSSFALSAAIKASTLYQSGTTTLDDDSETIQVRCGLSISPILLHFLIAAHPSTAHLSHVFTMQGLIYLTAVVDYLLSEVVELTGQTTLSFATYRIEAKHIFFAIRGDEELFQLFPGIIRDGGTLPVHTWTHLNPGKSLTAPIFHSEAIDQVCRKELKELGIISDPAFTAEACDLIRVLLEGYLIMIAFKARKMIQYTKRVNQTLLPEDILIIQSS